MLIGTCIELCSVGSLVNSPAMHAAHTPAGRLQLCAGSRGPLRRDAVSPVVAITRKYS